jgi:integrase
MAKKKPHPPLFRGSPHLKQWQKCYEEWLCALQERTGSSGTAISYRSRMELFFKDPRRAPETYTRDDIAAHIRSPVHKADGDYPPEPGTRNSRLIALRSFYAFAAQYYVPFHGKPQPLLRSQNPCSGLRIIAEGQKPKGLSEEQLKRFFAAIPRETIRDKRDYALMSFYFWTARRRNEILRLTWGDIYEVTFLKDGVPYAGHMYKFSSKGHSRDTFTAELRDEAYEALIDYLKAAGRMETMQPGSPLFIRLASYPGPERAMSGTAARDIVLRYAQMADLEMGRSITLHDFRHTRAQLEFETEPSDHALLDIKTLLGHAHLDTTLRYLGTRKKRDTGAERLAAKLGTL